jgi:hypothetical protein
MPEEEEPGAMEGCLYGMLFGVLLFALLLFGLGVTRYLEGNL